MKVDAVVLAGGAGEVIDPDARFKGLLPIAGKPMVEWVVDALKEAPSIAEVAVVVPTAEDLGLWVNKVDKLVVADQAFFKNILAGLGAFRSDRPALIITGDLPALCSEDIEDFIAAALATNADFVYPLVRKQDMIEQFPGSKRTYIRLVEGEITGGNMMLVNPQLGERNKIIGQKLFDTRKSALRMAGALGFSFVVKLVTGRLRVVDVEKKMTQLLGGPGAAVFSARAAIGADVDKPIDVIVAEKVLYARSGRS
ncbi:MAG: nucleotidyltransferase family protein [Actinobacteria bacterium]|nr:nucleotidyltransferase family protein [Actinomycetota bacterium]